jgi:SAM-dependent methyltransferase
MTSTGERRPAGEPRRFDASTPSLARVYDASLGGKDNFDSDRSLLDRLKEVSPDFPKANQQNRQWLGRVVRFLAGTAGVDQFLDVGSGMPTDENTHDIAHRLNPDARVVYVDNDPSVLAFGRALLEDNDRVHFAAGDLRRPTDVLEQVAPILELDRPIALIQAATLHNVLDEDDPHAIMAEYTRALASGSYVAISHARDTADGGPLSKLMHDIMAAFASGGVVSVGRTQEQIEGYFSGLELLEPGVVPLIEWWPTGPRLTPVADVERLLVGGVGRKP